MKKILLFFSVLFVSLFTLNLHLYASNSYYLMSCAEQNIPTGYYSSVDTSSEVKMRQSLCNIISTGYVGNSYNTAWTIDSYADADPYNQGNIICIYTGQSMSKDTHGGDGWDREHIWCKSHGFKGKTASGGESQVVANEAFNDCHHLRAAEHMINVNRSDKDFGELTNPTSTDEYGCKWTDTIFEPRDEVKGDVARMLFYMMIRYGEYSPDTFPTAVDGANTEVAYNLALVDEDVTTTSMGNGRLGKLSTLLKWHYQDPVSDREIYRNNVVYLYQNNRNPFIDHPEYVDIAFENAIGSYTNPTVNPKEPDSETRSEVLYKTIGFEDSEGFVAQSSYNSTYIFGNDGEKWNTNYAAVGSSTAMTGSQNMQMRWYSSSPRMIPECAMTYDVDNLSKVSFQAKGVAGGKIAVMYSYDEGVTWHTNEEIGITSSKTTYTSVISSNGGLGNIRVGFKMVLPETTPTANTTYYLDEVKLYRCEDSITAEFAKEETKVNLNLKYDESSVTNIETYYTKVTNISDLTDGSAFIIVAHDIATYPYALGTYDSCNHRYNAAAITTKGDRVYFENPTLLSLEEGANEGTYAINIGGKYLGNDNTSKKPYLSPFDDVVANISWNITIDSTGMASVVLVGDSTNADQRKVMSLNTSSTNAMFSCYAGKQKSDVALYKKVTSEVTNTVYTYNNTYLRYAGIISKTMYQKLLSEDSNAVFGIALSKDGINYTNYACTVALANLVDGKLQDNANGTYAYFAVKLLTPKENFESTVYAKAYVIVDGETFYMKEKVYSVNDLVNYYLANVTLTDEEKDLLGGLIQ